MYSWAKNSSSFTVRNIEDILKLMLIGFKYSHFESKNCRKYGIHSLATNTNKFTVRNVVKMLSMVSMG